GLARRGNAAWNRNGSDGGNDTRNRSEFGSKTLVEGAPHRIEVVAGDRQPELVVKCLHNGCHRTPEKSPIRGILVDVSAERGNRIKQNGDRYRLAVHEHAVAVEDDEPGRCAFWFVHAVLGLLRRTSRPVATTI